jgi:hypothetical protein
MLMMNILRVGSKGDIISCSFDLHPSHGLFHAQDIFSLVQTTMSECKIANVGTLSDKITVDTASTAGVIMTQQP